MTMAIMAGHLSNVSGNLIGRETAEKEEVLRTCNRLLTCKKPSPFWHLRVHRRWRKNGSCHRHREAEGEASWQNRYEYVTEMSRGGVTTCSTVGKSTCTLCIWKTKEAKAEAEVRRLQDNEQRRSKELIGYGVANKERLRYLVSRWVSWAGGQ